MAKVERLPDHLANQIAAGEVVERPASVVKELVENALDARATRIVVEIAQGGAELIRVTDDGDGMTPEDARMALERHATSKIHAFEDLLGLSTFGFRGEALPSIASVARLTLTTRARGADEGVVIEAFGGPAGPTKPWGCAAGTSVAVADLFFNVPARRKFLKATGTESAHVGEVVLLAALARPEVTFQLLRDRKAAREYLRASSREERVGQVMGDERLEPCSGARGPLKVEAYLSAPERARAGATGLQLFVNNRPVRDRGLARSIAQAYGSVLDGGRYPVGVCYLDLPAELVDVNVHPQKAEVRFADARGTMDAVTRLLHSSLARAFSLPALGSSRPWSLGSGALAPDFRPRPSAWPSGNGQRSTGVSTARGFEGHEPRPCEAPVSPKGTFETQLAAPLAKPEQPVDPSGDTLFSRPGYYANLRYLAQVRAMFLLCEADDGLVVLDQHAAAERVTFERLRRGYAAKSVASQRLLVPEMVEMTAAEIAQVEENVDLGERLGFELRALGQTTMSVHAVPHLLSRATAERLVRDWVAELSREATRPLGNAIDLVLATMACHGSIRAGDVLSPAEARALIDELDEVEFAGHCPHGRPIVMKLTFAELERLVGR